MLLTKVTPLLSLSIRDLAGDFVKNLLDDGVVGVLDAATISNDQKSPNKRNNSQFSLKPNLHVDKTTPLIVVGPTYDLSSLSWR